RSPAISSYSPPPASRTRMGWSTPSSRTEAASELNDSSSKCRRGWWGLGRMDDTGTSRRAEVSPPTTPLASGGMSAPSPLPSPLRRATAHLLGQLAVGDGAPRGRIERDDGLPERRSFGQPDRAGDHV